MIEHLTVIQWVTAFVIGGLLVAGTVSLVSLAWNMPNMLAQMKEDIIARINAVEVQIATMNGTVAGHEKEIRALWETARQDER